MNSIRTWAKGYFIDKTKYSFMPDEWKDEQRQIERCLVRPDMLANAICQCPNPEDAKWVAQRLNLASKLEQLTYDYAMGKSDGSEIVEYVSGLVND